MAAVLEEARARVSETAIDGLYVEDKTVMVALHYRPARDHEAARAVLKELAKDLAAEYGIDLSESKMAIELKPPVEFSKAQVVAARSRDAGLAAALYAGDDIVDLSAFDALDELSDEGIATLRAAVDSEEAPRELIARADVVLDGPGGVVAFLERLAGR
jgi:trehalose 6-phosphate phosphatase